MINIKLTYFLSIPKSIFLICVASHLKLQFSCLF